MLQFCHINKFHCVSNDTCLIARRVTTCRLNLKKIIDLRENCHRRLSLQDCIFKDAVVRKSDRKYL